MEDIEVARLVHFENRRSDDRDAGLERELWGAT